MKALVMALKNHPGRRRWTKLREWLSADGLDVSPPQNPDPLSA
jgi:hypothetical protein